jgi:hypothetical protein
MHATSTPDIATNSWIQKIEKEEQVTLSGRNALQEGLDRQHTQSMHISACQQMSHTIYM